jgi:hypothetical protein
MYFLVVEILTNCNHLHMSSLQLASKGCRLHLDTSIAILNIGVCWCERNALFVRCWYVMHWRIRRLFLSCLSIRLTYWRVLRHRDGSLSKLVGQIVQKLFLRRKQLAWRKRELGKMAIAIFVVNF